jgi:hypothetical protein
VRVAAVRVAVGARCREISGAEATGGEEDLHGHVALGGFDDPYSMHLGVDLTALTSSGGRTGQTDQRSGARTRSRWESEIDHQHHYNDTAPRSGRSRDVCLRVAHGEKHREAAGPGPGGPAFPADRPCSSPMSSAGNGRRSRDCCAECPVGARGSMPEGSRVNRPSALEPQASKASGLAR